MNVEGLSRLGFDPISIYIGYILLEEGLVVQLAKQVSKQGKGSSGWSLRAERTGGML